MGPNEAQLRAALHEGEGESLDATALISHAVHVRRDRRRRVTSIVGAAVVVAVVGLGTAGLVALGRGGDQGAASAGGQGAASSVAADAAGGKAAEKNPASAASSKQAGTHPGLPACPATPTHYRLPGAGGLLFDRPVEAMRMCAYPDGPAPTAATITGAEARSLANTLNTGSRTPVASVKCPAIAGNGWGTIELLAVDASGAAFKPVVITVGCGSSPATNGTALRFLANVPARVLKLLPLVRGQVVGSPVR
jgi:hypothetical protein